MFNNYLQIYKIGKELGLSKKDVDNIFLFKYTKHSILYTFLLIIFIVFTIIIYIIIGLGALSNIYPSGALYATVKHKDFEKILKNKRKRFVRRFF